MTTATTVVEQPPEPLTKEEVNELLNSDFDLENEDGFDWCVPHFISSTLK